DNVADVLASNPYWFDSSGKMAGRIDAISGKDQSTLWTVEGAPDSSFGWAIARAGDVNGDGHIDCLVGAADDWNYLGIQTGSVTVISGKNGSILYKVYGDEDGDLFGYSVRGVGDDLDGDGVNDFVVG